MNGDIREYIQQCEICNSTPRSQPDEPLMSHEVPDRPWKKVRVDLFEVKGTSYVIVVDYFSNFWEIDRLSTTTTAAVIHKLKMHFARYGSPAVLISDNGPQFASEEFAKFANNWDFEHRTSSPHHPQANGMAESAVKTAKQMIVKCAKAKHDVYMAILDYRNTPTQDMGSSPAQRMLGRRTRTLLPTMARLLQPRPVDTSVTQKLKRLQNRRSAWYHDRHTKSLTPLEEGDSVRIKPHILGKKIWDQGIVNRRLDQRSYEVETDAGVIRRNRVDLRKTHETTASSGAAMDTQPGLPPDKVYPSETPTDIEVVDQPSVADTVPRPKTPAKLDISTPRPVRGTRNKLPSRFKDFEVKM